MKKSNNLSYIRSILLTASICAFSNIHAQSGSKVDSTTIITIEAYQPFLKDAFKIKDNPSIDDTGKITPNLKYTFIDKQVPVDFTVNPISPAKIKGEPLVKLYRGYAKVGFGTNTTPLIDIYYNATRSKTFNYGFTGNHFSSSGITGNDYSGFSDNHLGLFGKRILKEFSLYSKVNFDRHVVHYYGFPPENNTIITNPDAIKQGLNKLSAVASLTRNYTDTNQFDYNFDINYHHINDVYDVSENHFALDGNLSKYHKRELYEIGVEANYNGLNNLLDLKNNLLVGLKPHISTIAKKWAFQIGLGLFVNSQEETNFHFYPQAEFKYNIADNIVIPYVGIRGGMQANSLNKFFMENPFINTNEIGVVNTNKKYDVYAGIRGSLTSNLSFNTSFSKQKLEGLPLYIKDITNIQNKFIVTYDTLDLIQLDGELTYHKLEKWKILLSGNYYGYTPKNEIKAWHRPDFKIALSSIYDLGDKIIVRADLFYIGQQYAKINNIVTTNNTVTITDAAETLKGVFDANIGVEYRYTKKLSAFINFNNIGSVKYERWQDYPTQRFGVLGGLTYAF
ncbi:MAG: hypothetical protein J5I47_07410 [Vicingus serpentipes]|nr:hypothetical protein [Vicingus serpentipes]